jgi:NAD(P)-dependent dehydrogenase (short-subunit alcohol dehydrogenase family)
MGKLVGRVAIVTGGGSGIGRASAELFASEGATVAVFDLRADAAEETAAKLVAEGAEAHAFGVDVTDSRQVSDAVDQVVHAWGRLDVLFNNAGIDDGHKSILDANEAEWDRVFAVNVKGTFICSRASAPHLSSSGSGAIVNQASVAGLVGIRNLAAYSAAKGAVISLTRSMAVDLAPRVRVNAICPGTVVTPMIESLLLTRGEGDREAGLAQTVAKYPLGRLGRPEEIARVALFLVSEDSSFLTGCIMPADGGMTVQ